MMKDFVGASTFFASDVHWTPVRAGDEDPTGLFGRFLKDLAARARDGHLTQLYVVGDLFDFWYERDGKAFSFYTPHLMALREARQAGVEIYVLFGNRDFLHHAVLVEQCGVELLGDRAEVSIADKRILLHHGDLFCTRDRRYQVYRRLIRSRVARALFRLVPLAWVERIIRRMQKLSEAEIRRKPGKSMDVVDDVIRREHEQGYELIICGHVHKAEERQVSGAPPGATLITLGSWTMDAGWYAAALEGAIHLHVYH
jgi:UDP-2,3-diacylglucosamine hydrolase